MTTHKTTTETEILTDEALDQAQGGFFAYNPSFTGGVRVATGDVNGDGAAEVITSPGQGGGPHVRVFDGS